MYCIVYVQPEYIHNTLREWPNAWLKSSVVLSLSWKSSLTWLYHWWLWYSVTWFLIILHCCKGRSANARFFLGVKLLSNVKAQHTCNVYREVKSEMLIKNLWVKASACEKPKMNCGLHGPSRYLINWCEYAHKGSLELHLRFS